MGGWVGGWVWCPGEGPVSRRQGGRRTRPPDPACGFFLCFFFCLAGVGVVVPPPRCVGLGGGVSGWVGD